MLLAKQDGKHFQFSILFRLMVVTSFSFLLVFSFLLPRLSPPFEGFYIKQRTENC